jgi:cytidylate kinase
MISLMKDEYARIIAIDGPAGAGKSTIAKMLAKRLHYLYIDTGAMYRALAWCAIKQGVAFDDDEGLGQIARAAQITLKDGEGGYQVFCNGQDISREIRLPEVGAAASPVSASKPVRQALLDQQRCLAAGGRVVMDGRDIGTVVLPNADCKIFLTASLDERAKRRMLEQKAKGQACDPAEVRQGIAERDQRDSSRTHAPLRQAQDAVLLDTTGLNIDQVVSRALAIAKAKL